MTATTLIRVVLVVGAVTVAGCTTASTTTSTAAVTANADVTIDNFSFGPTTVQISTGESVTWTNAQSVAHTTTAREGSWDSSSLQTDAEFTVTFEEAGTFDYFCSIHPSMSGAVVVS